jgi:hypothetical protein
MNLNFNSKDYEATQNSFEARKLHLQKLASTFPSPYSLQEVAKKDFNKGNT